MQIFLVTKGATYEAEETISAHKTFEAAKIRCRELAKKTVGKILSEYESGPEFNIECQYCYYTIEIMELE